MPLEFGNDFCTPCEPIAGVQHEGNDPITCPIAIVDVVYVHLPELNTISLLGGYIALPLTVSAV